MFCFCKKPESEEYKQTVSNEIDNAIFRSLFLQQEKWHLLHRSGGRRSRGFYYLGGKDMPTLYNTGYIMFQQFQGHVSERTKTFISHTIELLKSIENSRLKAKTQKKASKSEENLLKTLS